MANPKVFLEHIVESVIVNRNDIASKAEDMENNYKADDWFNVGIDLGSLLSEGTLGEVQP